MTGGVERVLRWVYTVALAFAAPLLLAGLLTHAPGLLEAGVLTVMITPLLGAVILAVSMALARDWPFTPRWRCWCSRSSPRACTPPRG